MTQDVQFVAPFFVLEGDEGTGKGTVATKVVERLTAKGIEFVHTREPGGTELGEVLRQQLLLKREEPLEKVTHILLHQAYRKEHIEKVILPALYSGKVVLCERFFMSTLALNIMPYIETQPELYQLFMDTMPYIGSNVIEPVTLILDIEDEAVRKARLTDRELDFYESRTPEELEATSNAYKMFQKHPTSVTLDATKSPDELADHIVAQIEAQLAQAKEKAREFAEQEAKREQAAAQAEQNIEIPAELRELDSGVAEQPVVEEPTFNLEESVEGFLAENLVPALFNHDASQVEKYLPLARSFVLSIYNQIQDPGLFVGQNRAQLRTNMHSIFHYGHQMDLIRDRSNAPAAEAVAE
ncbi:thymidylate kinase [Pseudomonas phage D6]|nr:thymidylate kinase [Pseudomonas phage D6]